MRDHFFTPEHDWIKNHCIGLGSSFATFCVIWPIDTTSTRLRFYKDRIFSGGIHQSFCNYRDAISPDQCYTGMGALTKSFFNVGFYWGFLYTLSTGALTLPLQKEFQNHFVQNKKGEHDHDIDVIFLKALAGWCAAFIQLVLLHPVDSMKVTAQKNLALLNNGSIHYFLTKQAQLRRGMGVVALGSLTHFVAWNAKLITQRSLQDKIQDANLLTIISALTFSVTHIALAFPVNTVKTWAQGDQNFVADNKRFIEKARRTREIAQQNIKRLGASSLYRGFFSRGSMHVVSFALNMTLFDMLQKPTR